MLAAGGGQTPNTNKGRAGVDASTIPPIGNTDIKQILEIAQKLSIITPQISYCGFVPQKASASHPLPGVRASAHQWAWEPVRAPVPIVLQMTPKRALLQRLHVSRPGPADRRKQPSNCALHFSGTLIACGWHHRQWIPVAQNAR